MPLVTQLAPNFSAKAVNDGQIVDISLGQYKGKLVVLVFYPLDFTFVCPTEITAFSDRIKEFKDLNTEVLCISTDSEYSHFAWSQMPRSEGGLSPISVPLVSDITKSISKSYDVLINDAIALRGLYIIDEEGIIRQQIVNDLPIGRSVDEVIRLIKALKFHQEHGDVCPANWKEGQASIIPDIIKAKGYFSKAS